MDVCRIRRRAHSPHIDDIRVPQKGFRGKTVSDPFKENFKIFYNVLKKIPTKFNPSKLPKGYNFFK